MRRAIAVAAVLGTVIACGSKEDQQAEQAKKQAEQQTAQAAQTADQAAQQAAKGLEAMAKSLEAAVSGGSGEAKPVDPVSFRDLMTLLPEIDGWEKHKPTGERMTSPVSFSQAEGRYSKGESSIEVKIIDSGFNQLLLTPYAMFLAAGYERETSEGHEKSTKVNGQPGWEKWNSESKDGEVNALVGKRFLVTINGDRIDDVKQLHEVANKMDMGRLAAMK